jgi:prepilin-type N-terminal cleavage/methylation domain-containing protein
MASLKKAFTLIELMVVISVMAILSTIVVFGIRSAGNDEGVKADYRQLYDDMKSLKLRANLGKQGVEAGTSVQAIGFQIGASPFRYSVNNATYNIPMRNLSRVVSVSDGTTTYTSGSFAIFFYPENYVTNGVYPTSFAMCCGSVKFSNNVIINVTGANSLISYPITISGSGFRINTINVSYVANSLPIMPTSTPEPTATMTPFLSPTPQMTLTPTLTLTPAITSTPTITPTPACICSSWVNNRCANVGDKCLGGQGEGTGSMIQSRTCNPAFSYCQISRCVVDVSCAPTLTPTLTPTPVKKG